MHKILYPGVMAFVMFSLAIHAQHDTTHLPLHVVNGYVPPYRDGSWHVLVDSTQRMMMRNGTLADLLAVTHPVSIRYYGPGQLATASFRGASASQTVVVWNGIRINNPMLMQTDLSSIPVVAVEEGGILFGGATLRETSGAFGGVVSLQSNIDTTTENRLEVSHMAGSYGHFSYRAQYQWRYRQTASRTIYYREQAANDYHYTDNFYQPGTEARRHNASWFQQGVIHQTGWQRKNGYTGQISLWGQQKLNYIPYPIHQPQKRYTQWQSDDSWRLIMNGRKRYGAYSVGFNTGLQQGVMHYHESRSGVRARHETRNLQQKVYVSRDGYRLQSEVSADYELQQAITSEYGGITPFRHLVSVYGSAVTYILPDLWIGARARTEYVYQYGTHFLPALSGGYRTGTRNRHLFQWAVMRNRQVPGLNDLYWVPGGNPDLLPESGYGGEISWQYAVRSNKAAKLTSKINLYHQKIQQKIMWLPGSDAIWSPRNLGNIRMNGAEYHINYTRKMGRYTMAFDAKAAYTRAVRLTEDDIQPLNQLVYVPQWAASAAARLQMPGATMQLETVYTGKRFTNLNNTTWMPAYTLTNFRLNTVDISAANFFVNGFFSVCNLFNQNYQTIAWHPMPGRVYRVGMTWSISPDRKPELLNGNH